MIKGKTIDLRPIEKQDIEMLRRWRNENADSFFTSDQITVQQQRAWYQHYQDNYGKDFMFIIQLKDDTSIGTVALYNMDNADRTADVGRMLLLEKYRGCGYMEEALSLIVDEAFTKMRLYRLKLGTYLDNAGAISLYHKAGFKALKRPVMLMEMTNPNMDWKKPLVLRSYDEPVNPPGYINQWIEDNDKLEDYENQSTNIK